MREMFIMVMKVIIVMDYAQSEHSELEGYTWQIIAVNDEILFFLNLKFFMDKKMTNYKDKSKDWMMMAISYMSS